MIELRSSTVTARFSPLGAKLVSCVVDGIETVFGAGTRGLDDQYAGAICGRHAGRISHAQFPLDGKMVELAADPGGHQLHGGAEGFHVRRWDYMRDGNRVTFQLHSNHGDQGFPGNLSATAAYELRGSTLSLDIQAHSSEATVCNITNHAYWNMAGGGSVLDLELMIAGDYYFPLSDLLLPKGEIVPVEKTIWDFRTARRIAQDYDGCILLNGTRGEMKRGLMLRDPKSGRQLDVWTSEGCMQFYTAIHWNAAMADTHGPLTTSTALAIEPQNIADAPNNTNFPSSILRGGEVYRNRMEWRFS
jgi:aldose 1-epimerase